jgi:gliding-associated putative ABC transporter substrate-binding component GldG
MLIIIIVLVVIGQLINLRYDLTKNQRHTLSSRTKMLLKNIDQPLKIDIFLEGKLPAEFLRLRKEISELIKSFQQNTDQIVYEYIDPFEGAKDTNSLVDEMKSFGITPEYIVQSQSQAVEQTVVFPWAMLSGGNRTMLIPLIQKNLGDNKQQKINRSIEHLEFQFYNALYKLVQKNKETIAILTSHGASKNIVVADFMRSLQPYYQLAAFDLKALKNEPEKTIENLNRFKMLIVSNPSKAFTDYEKYLLDQYTLQGGKSLWMINPTSINRDSLFNLTGKSMAVSKKYNLGDLFFKYGLRLENDLVKDLYSAPIVLANGEQNNSQYLPMPWTYYGLPLPNENHPIGKSAGNVLLQFPSSIDTLKNNIKKTILLKSSAFTKTIKTPVTVYLSEAVEKLIPSEFNKPSRNIGILLKGKFNSAFNNRIKPVKLTRNLSKGASEIIVIADGNIAENQVDKGNPLELGFDKWTNNFYANKIFLQNCVHHLMGNSSLLEIRNKEVGISFLDPKKVANQESLWKASMLVLPPILLAILGFILFRYRTNKFGQ